MRILLHIGMTKAGSSALQTGLFAQRKQLIKGGVLYPDGGRGRPSHTLLVHGLVPSERLPRWLRQAYGGDTETLGRDAGAWLAHLKERIDAARPQILILSEEFLFLVVDHDVLIELRQRLCDLGDTVEVIAYVRRPSEHYLSSVQQLLKASHRIQGPNPIAYRPALEGYANHVADRMHVVRYERGDWPEGDILRHFLATFLPELQIRDLGPPQQVNESLSAEAMSLLAEYRSRIWPDDHNRFTPDTNRLVRALTSSDIEVSGERRPHLHERIARTVDQASTDLLWLRDQHGITFDGVDYNNLQPPERKHPPLERIDDICAVDADRRSDLTVRAMYHLAKAGPRNTDDDVVSTSRAMSHGVTSWAKGLIRRVAVLVRDFGVRRSAPGG